MEDETGCSRVVSLSTHRQHAQVPRKRESRPLCFPCGMGFLFRTQNPVLGYDGSSVSLGAPNANIYSLRVPDGRSTASNRPRKVKPCIQLICQYVLDYARKETDRFAYRVT